MECYEIFAKNLKALREEQGLSRQALSAQLGMTKTRIGDIENNYRSRYVKLYEAVVICEYFKVSLDQMVYLDLTKN